MRNFPFIFIVCTVVMQPQSLLAQTDNVAAGKVIFSSGINTAVSAGGKSRVVKQGDTVRSGDRLQTETGHLQVRFTDSGFVSLKPKSQLVISDYRFDGKEDGTERAFFNLLKGSMRAVTGLIGKRNRDTFKYTTSVATIGIRGTAFVLTLCNNDCFAADGSLLPNGLYANNGEGRMYMQTNGGTIDLIRGQFAFVPDIDSKPQQIMQPPALRDLFRDTADNYDFDFRSAELAVEQIRAEPIIDDDVLPTIGELQALTFAFFSENDGIFPSGGGFSVVNNPGNNIQADSESAVTGFSFETGNGTIAFNSGSATLINSGVDLNQGVSWGVWDAGHTLQQGSSTFNSLYLHYIATDNPTPVSSMPNSGMVHYSGSTGEGNVLGTLGQYVSGEFVTDFSILMDIDFSASNLTNLQLSGLFADGSSYTAFLNSSDGPTQLTSGSTFAPLSGDYSDPGGSVITSLFGSTQLFFTGDAAESVMGHYTLIGDASQHSFIGTYAVGQTTIGGER